MAVEKTQEFGIFDPTKFLEEFAKKVEEITKLKQATIETSHIKTT